MTEIITISPAPDALDRAVDVIRTAHEQAGVIPANVIRAGAMLALQVGANPNPLSGELYIYQIMGRWTPYLGIAYYRRIAEENGARVMFAPRDDETRLSWEPRPMTDEERADYKVPDGTDAAICRGYRGDRLIELLDRGVPWRDAVQMLARTGIAFLRDEEKKDRTGKYMNAPNGRSWQWKCDKRAEMDLYRKLGVVAHSVVQAELAAASEDDDPPATDRQRYTVEEANRDLF